MMADRLVHETAVIDDGAVIGADTRVWHFVHVSGGARIGSNVVLGQNVFVGNRVSIGDGCRIQNNVSVYDDVTLEDDVFCGPSMVFTNVANPRAFVSRKEEFAPTLVKRGATLGANCTILCGITVGEYAFVAAGAVVTRHVAPYSLVAGVPAQPIGWMSRVGRRLDLPAEGEGRAVCPESAERYELRGNELIPL